MKTNVCESENRKKNKADGTKSHIENEHKKSVLT